MSAATRELYRVQGLPIFQNRMYATADEAIACPQATVRLVEDLDTGLVSNADFDPARMLYDRDYQNEQGISPFFRRHLEEVAGIVERAMGRGPVVEVGCGKGTFLGMMRDRGFEAIGFDPAYEGDSPHVVRACFEPSTGIRAESVVLRHVLEHIRDPVSFLEVIRQANRGGRIYIEVPCFDWICAHRAWFDVLYEHVNYFRLEDFHRMFGVIHASGRFFGGQYMYVVADLASLRRPVRDPARAVEFPADFHRSLGRAMQRRTPADFAVWGAASRGVIFSLRCHRLGFPIPTLIDINPAKQRRHIACTGLRVQAPEEALASLPADGTIIVMNSNYFSEIQAMSGNRFHCIKAEDDLA